MPITDYQDALVAAEEALARSKALREGAVSPQGRMVGKFYVPPSWEQRLSPYWNAAGAEIYQARGNELAKQGRQGMEADAQAWMQSRPQPTQQTIELPGPQEADVEGPLTGQQTVEPTQQQNLEWAQRGVNNPLTKALAAQYGSDVLIKEPERQENREYRAHEAQLARDATRERWLSELQQRADAAEQRSRDARYSADAQAAARQDANAIRMQIAQMTRETALARIESDRDRANQTDATNRYRIDQRLATNRGKMSAKHLAELDNADSISNGIDLAIERLDKVKDWGTGAYTRGLITEKIPGGERIASGIRSDEDNQARQTAFDVAGGIQHGRYGTALTQTEKGAAGQYIPTPYDDAQRIREKLAGLKELMRLNDSRLRLMEQGGISMEEAARAFPMQPGLVLKPIKEGGGFVTPPKAAAAPPTAPASTPARRRYNPATGMLE